MINTVVLVEAVSNLQFQTEQHGQEDKTETQQADGQADQPSEHCPLPRWVVEFLTARDRTAPLHSLDSSGTGNGERIGETLIS